MSLFDIPCATSSATCCSRRVSTGRAGESDGVGAGGSDPMA
jgi:hypothetical protein